MAVQQDDFRIPAGQPAVEAKFHNPAFAEPASMPDPAGAGVQGGAAASFSQLKYKQHGGDALCYGKALAVQEINQNTYGG
ncbi:hypothetical protein [Oscillibacter sp. CU971]|uniref:hypothetical protein n=1 Tax=Oscillibacter sp. CU971 TaxID=2780102 RepID=UPI00195735B4|nr:hypothetical protein [Oscillibacter sp. CU971]